MDPFVQEPTDGLGGITYSDEQLLKEKGYQFIKQLGEGSYAKVYLTLHTKTGKPDATLACKVINAKKAPREYVTKFLPRELDIIGKVAHPNIIHTDAIFNRNNKFLIFMRYAENGDLLEYVLRKGEIKESVARVWLYQLCLAIQYLHVLEIAHRDIKCENILISTNYNIKLADFGFARFVTLNGRPIMSTTYCGSLIYASPEILKGKPYYPKCSDIWSLGIVTYIMLNKTMPFSETNTRALHKLQMEKQWNFRRKIIPTLTQGVMSLVHKMLEPNYKARVTVDDVVDDKYFKEYGLEMTETEKMALNYANKHKQSLQSQKKINVSDTFITGMETGHEPFYSTTAVTTDSVTAGLQNTDKTAGAQPAPPQQPEENFNGTEAKVDAVAEARDSALSKERGIDVETNSPTIV
ncbi:hypothetical protein GE061_006552 [Apolygus lucorum]|uniref:Protein kinase domain-containing protein n=1 Tax=Apolygus lucorum TaxID=248454 RepID=A0A6A4IZM4_APOLU|nr:hypothetical protein GE061_006552 [Apolygus lucorum]